MKEEITKEVAIRRYKIFKILGIIYIIIGVVFGICIYASGEGLSVAIVPFGGIGGLGMLWIYIGKRNLKKHNVKLEKNNKYCSKIKEVCIKNKKIFHVICFVLLIVLISLTVLKLTEYSRYRARQINLIQEKIDYYLEVDVDKYTYQIPFKSSLEEKLENDIVYREFMTDQTKLIVKNKPKIFENFYRRFRYDYIMSTAIETYKELENTDDVLDFFAFFIECQDWLELDMEQENLIRAVVAYDSQVISSYFEKKGAEIVTTTPGEGYYADANSSYDFDRIGLDNSPLYTSNRVSYRGDFMCKEESGVKLNSFYEEQRYANSWFYFRDKEIDFFPGNKGKCIYSGDYLFWFGDNNELLEFKKFN